MRLAFGPQMAQRNLLQEDEFFALGVTLGERGQLFQFGLQPFSPVFKIGII